MSRRDDGAARARAPTRTLTRQARRGFLLFRVNLPRTTTARAYTLPALCEGWGRARSRPCRGKKGSSPPAEAGRE